MNQEREYAIAFTTVDIAPVNANLEVLLAKKLNETKYRFIGGFVDPKKDNDYTDAASRELLEETGGEEYGLDIRNERLSYIGNIKVIDSRYKDSRDKIFTNLFYTRLLDSDHLTLIKPTDDISELRWFKISSLQDKSVVELLIEPVHHPLVEMFLAKCTEKHLV